VGIAGVESEKMRELICLEKTFEKSSFLRSRPPGGRDTHLVQLLMLLMNPAD
jgi:hypothetical protein